MPNQHSTLTGLFTDIASAIREKDGSSAPIIADAFPSAIRAIPSGGGGDHDAEDALVTRTISTYTNDRVTKIGDCAFCFYSSLTAVSFPACTTIGSSAFGSCSSLTTVSFPACTTIGSSAFGSCTSLESVSFPACTVISSYAFANCTSLESISFPVCTSIIGYAFLTCTNLKTISFPACTSIGANAFFSCTSLTSISLPVCTYIGGSAFSKCYNLLFVYLYTSSVCILSRSNAFTSTPIAGYTSSTSGVYGSIYVPMSLLSAYQASTNWTYFRSRFVGVNPEDM